MRLLALLACALALVPNRARAEVPEVEIARGHSRRGSALYQESRFAEAAAEFELARKELPIAELDYNLGRCYEGTGDVEAALAAYRRFLTHATSFDTHAEVSERVRLLEAASPAARNRQAARARAARDRRTWRRLAPAAYTLAAIAVGSGVASGALYSELLGQRDALALGCPPHCTHGLYDEAQRTRTATYALFGVAVGAAAVDVVLLGVGLSARARARAFVEAR